MGQAIALMFLDIKTFIFDFPTESSGLGHLQDLLVSHSQRAQIDKTSRSFCHRFETFKPMYDKIERGDVVDPTLVSLQTLSLIGNPFLSTLPRTQRR